MTSPDHTVMDASEARLYELRTGYRDGKTFLVSMKDPGAYSVAAPLVRALKTDPRCALIGCLVSGLARQDFEREFADATVFPRDAGGILEDLLVFAASTPIDAVVATTSTLNGPESVLLFGGKSSLKAKKIFLISDGWTGIGYEFDSAGRIRMDEIDAILCNDAFAKRVILNQDPQLTPEQIIPIGSPILDEALAELTPSVEREARKQMGIGEEEIALLFLGDVTTAEGERFDLDLNRKTLDVMMEGVRMYAADTPDQSIVVIVRPHPRDDDGERLMEYAETLTLPENVRCIRAGLQKVSVAEVRAASDAVCSVNRTENFIAPHLGRKVAFLAFEGPGLGADELRWRFSEDVIAELAQHHGVTIARSAADMAAFLRGVSRTHISEAPMAGKGSSIQRLLHLLFEAI